MSKTILANVDGFTPVIDSVVDDLGLIAAVVFGRMWRYCQMEDSVCKASLETIGDSIGVDRATVMRHAKDLCQAGYLKDLTPELRNRPHVYVDTGKAGLKLNISGIAQSNTENVGVAESDTTLQKVTPTVAESKLNKVFNTEVNKPLGKKFSNPLWDLQHGKTPELSEGDQERIELEQAYTEIAAKLEVGLRRGSFPQTPKAQSVYKWIVKKEEIGQSLDRFIQWAMRDEKSAEFSWVYHKDPDLIKRDWMQAFPANLNPDEKRASSFYG